MKSFGITISALASVVLTTLTAPAAEMTIWHRRPASQWNEATPVGNGRLGAMIFGRTGTERIQLNEDSLWSGAPQDADNPEALKALPQIRQLLFDGKYTEAQELANRHLICKGPGSNRGRGGKVAYGSMKWTACASSGKYSPARRTRRWSSACARIGRERWISAFRCRAPRPRRSSRSVAINC